MNGLSSGASRIGLIGGYFEFAGSDKAGVDYNGSIYVNLQTIVNPATGLADHKICTLAPVKLQNSFTLMDAAGRELQVENPGKANLEAIESAH